LKIKIFFAFLFTFFLLSLPGNKSMKKMGNLFEEQQKGFEFIGQGFALKKIDNNNKVHLYKNGVFVKEQPLNPTVEKRLFVVDLVERQGVTRTKLATSLGISRQSINNWVDTYRKHGSIGLVNNSKDSWKKNPKRFTGNKARDLEQERLETKQEQEQNQISISFGKEVEVEEKYCGPANQLYCQEYDYQENRYSGSMLYVGILNKNFNFLKQLSALVGDYLWVPFMFILMHINKMPSSEQLKTVYRKEFGQLLGLGKLPHLEKVRENITGLIGLKQAKGAVVKFFKVQVIKGFVSIWRIFLDGHFVPYTGKEKVHKSYNTQRDMMMPGNTEFFSHDSTGHIVHFDIQEGKGDIVKNLQQVSQQLKPYNNETPPLVVVDRELWGVDKFIELSSYRFVTWEKYCDKAALKQLPGSCFTTSLEFGNIKYLLFEENKAYKNIKGKTIELRRVIARNTKTTETIAIVTNDTIETTEVIADSMLNRWGCSENGFKHMGTRTNMHYNPKWEIEQASQEQSVYNPEYSNLKKQLKQKKGLLAKITKELGKKEPVLKKDGTPRKSPARDKKIAQKKQLEQDIELLKQQIGNCPERVEMTDIGKSLYKTIDTEAKNWWNIAEMLFWNSRKKLSRLLFQYLPNNRDLLPVLDAITHAKGWMKSTKTMIIVRLEPLEIKRYRDAQIQLCRYLNTMKIKLPNGKLLQYDVGHNPYSVKK
jgi:transposase